MSFGPIAGIMGRMGGADVRRPGRPGARQARRRGRHQHRRRPAARPRGHRRARAAERGRLRRRPGPARRRGAAVPRAARGRLASGCSPTCRGCASSCRTPSTPTPAASRSTARRSSAGSTEAMSGMEGGIDPSNPESIQQLLGSGVLEPEETPEQQMALRRLETLLALVEGWVDTVVAAAADGPAARALGAGRDDAPPPRLRRAGRADLRHAGRAASCGPAGCATPPPCGAPWASARQRRARPALVAPRPAADLGRPGRADGLRRPPGHGRRARGAHRGATPTRTAAEPRTPPERATTAGEDGARSVDGVAGGRRRPAASAAVGRLLDALEEARAPARPAGSARTSAQKRSSWPGSSRCTSSCTST